MLKENIETELENVKLYNNTLEKYQVSTEAIHQNLQIFFIILFYLRQVSYISLLGIFFIVIFRNRVPLCSPCYPGTHRHPPASGSQLLEVPGVNHHSCLLEH